MAFTYLHNASNTANATVYTFSAQNFGTESADRRIIVAVASRKAATPTTLSVTIGGVAATEVASLWHNPSDSQFAGIYMAHIPTGASGDIVLTFGAGMVRAGIGVYSVVGEGSIEIYDTASSNALDPSILLDIPEGGFALATASFLNASSAIWSGLTEDFDIGIEGQITFTSASDEGLTAETDRAISCNYSPSTTERAAVFASWSLIPAPTITTSSLPNGVVDTSYSETLGVTGGTGSITWSVVSGALPDGFTLNPTTGVLASSGVLTDDLIGDYTFTVQAEDESLQTDTQEYTISILAAPSISSFLLQTADDAQFKTNVELYVIDYPTMEYLEEVIGSAVTRYGRVRAVNLDGQLSAWSRTISAVTDP